MDGNMVIQGVELMLLGMGIVFGFLIMLVFVLRGMSLLAGRLVEVEPDEDIGMQAIDIPDQRQLIAVVSAAIARYRTSRTA